VRDNTGSPDWRDIGVRPELQPSFVVMSSCCFQQYRHWLSLPLHCTERTWSHQSSPPCRIMHHQPESLGGAAGVALATPPGGGSDSEPHRALTDLSAGRIAADGERWMLPVLRSCACVALDRAHPTQDSPSHSVPRQGSGRAEPDSPGWRPDLRHCRRLACREGHTRESVNTGCTCRLAHTEAETGSRPPPTRPARTPPAAQRMRP
jgi:hypothetical protein